MIVRSKAPLRLGLAGGGTDVEPYCSMHGGMVLNATIDLYAYCTIEEAKNILVFNASDRGETFRSKPESFLKIDGLLSLHKGVYNCIVKKFNNNEPLSLIMTTYSDAPAGSGLGSSSTMVVVILKAYVELLNLPLGEYDVARLAYQIEREDLGFSGGQQDQYATTFGGFNFMEFYKNNRVIINPLRIKNWIIDELESCMILYYTGVSRESSLIIDEQIKNLNRKDTISLNSSHALKEGALLMKEAVLKCDIELFSKTLGSSWEVKKMLSNSISNKMIENVYRVAIKAGAYSGKVSGAGGGGFMIFMVNPLMKYDLKSKLEKLDGNVVNFHFVKEGAKAWRV